MRAGSIVIRRHSFASPRASLSRIDELPNALVILSDDRKEGG
jgi:hypothetical protein